LSVFDETFVVGNIDIAIWKRKLDYIFGGGGYSRETARNVKNYFESNTEQEPPH
jgi:hypothetical protein